MSVIAVGGYNPVVFVHSRYHSCQDSFLTNIQVAKSTKFLLNIELAALFFKPAHQKHTLIPLQVGSFRKLCFFICGLLFLRRFCFRCHSVSKFNRQIYNPETRKHPKSSKALSLLFITENAY